MRKAILLSLISLVACACNPRTCMLEPLITYRPQEQHIGSLSTSFSPLTKEERQQEWSKELIFGNNFARELDLYRAITCYKRALLLIPKDNLERRRQLEYSIILCYYLGGKYGVVLETFENGIIKEVPATFPAFRNLLIVMYETFEKLNEYDKACRILNIIEECDPDLSRDLQIGTAITIADFNALSELVGQHPNCESINEWMDCYCLQKKSAGTAQALNAVLPGAGYLYIGQKKTALTSLLLNAAFISATYQLFKEDQIALGIIIGSLEFGWYFGGINGAGLGAKYYNENLYNQYGKEAMLEHRLFPVLMFQHAF